MHCPVDEHLLSGHAHSDKFGGSTTLLRCASAVIGDHKSTVLDEQHIIPLEDLCPYHQHVHLVANQSTSGPFVDRQMAVEVSAGGDDYRTSAELELHDRPVGDADRFAAYERLPSGGGFTASSTAARNNIRTSLANSRRSLVTFRPSPPQTTANIVHSELPVGAGTAPAGNRCVSVDLIKTLRASSASRPVDTAEMSYEDACESPPVGRVALTQPSSEACSAV